MFKTILFVCVGNICRSPMAEYMLKADAIAAGRDVTISSAGLGAVVGHGADATVIELLNERGIDAGDHVARQLNSEIVSRSELILTAELWQKKEIENAHLSARGKVFTIGWWDKLEVPDPYKQDREKFVETMHLVDQGLDSWKKRLWK